MIKKIQDALTQLVSFPSISSESNLEMISLIQSKMKAIGASTRVIMNSSQDKANLLASWGPDLPGGLILSAHSDVVPVDPAQWKYDPFTLTADKTKDGQEILYGRGTSDMKSFIAQAIVALETIDLKNLKKPLHLAISYDEEVGCIGVRSMIQEFQNSFQHMPSYALIGEPSNYQIGIAHKGHTQMVIEISGVEGHSSKIDEGVNAIKIAGEVLNLLKDLEKELRGQIKHKDLFPQYPFNTINVGKITGGKASNIIPDRCTIEMGYRTMPGDDPLAIYQLIKEKIAKKISATIDCQLEIAVPPMLTETVTPFEKSLQKITGNNNRIALPYTTEGGLFTAAGISSIICGPGSIEQAHKPNEYIAKDQLLPGCEYIQQLISDLL